jgi:phosphatidylglycerophosphate synthase
MFDHALRPLKERLLASMASRAAGRVNPFAITLASVVACVGAGVGAAMKQPLAAIILWLVGRALDGIDGAVARASDKASDLGGLVDQLADTIGYAAVPIGAAAASDDPRAWMLVAILLGTFYVNAVSWGYLSAIVSKRAKAPTGDTGNDRLTAISMPSGLVEGVETIVFFTLMLALPGLSTALFAAMSVAVVATVVQRTLTAKRLVG